MFGYEGQSVYERYVTIIEELNGEYILPNEWVWHEFIPEDEDNECHDYLINGDESLIELIEVF